jgi:hypothetical protein
MTWNHVRAYELWEQKKTDREIATDVGVSSDTIRKWRYKSGLASIHGYVATFKPRKSRAVRRDVPPEAVPFYQRVASSRRTMRRIVGVVAHVAGVSPDLLMGYARDGQTVALRWVCVRMGRARGVSFNSMGVVLDKDHSTILHAAGSAKKALAKGNWRSEYLIEIEARATAALAAEPDRDWLKAAPAKDAPIWANARYRKRMPEDDLVITATRHGYIRNGEIIVRPE